MAQFELYDVPAAAREREEDDAYTTGLAFRDGRRKPAWEAFRMPIVVSRLSGGRVEVWGQVRPADKRTTATVTVSPGPGQPFAAVTQAATNDAGYFRLRLRRAGATRALWRIEWTSPSGTVSQPGRQGGPADPLPGGSAAEAEDAEAEGAKKRRRRSRRSGADRRAALGRRLQIREEVDAQVVHQAERLRVQPRQLVRVEQHAHDDQHDAGDHRDHRVVVAEEAKEP